MQPHVVRLMAFIAVGLLVQIFRQYQMNCLQWFIATVLEQGFGIKTKPYSMDLYLR